MKNHFRTAVMTVILAGGTMTAYATAFAMMEKAPVTQAAAASETNPIRVQVSGATAKRLLSGQADVSVREACSTLDDAGARQRCMQEIAGSPRPVRVIDFASTESSTRIR